MPMAEVEQFSYGITNPVLACAMAYVGCLLGLICAAHGRTLPRGRQRATWLFAGAAAIGGGGIWLMHMMAMLGFDVEDTPIGFNVWLILGSLALAIAVISGGIFLVAYGKRSVPRLLVGGILTGIGDSGQHYVAMSAVHINGSFSFDPHFVALSLAISLVASTTALWFTLAARHGAHFLAAALVMAVAATGTHYSAMAALGVHVDETPHDVAGVQSTAFVIPILLLAIAALVCLLFAGLNVIGDDQFALRVNPDILAGRGPMVYRGPNASRPLWGTRANQARTGRPAPPGPPVRPGGAGPRPDRAQSLRAIGTSTSELRLLGADRERLMRGSLDGRTPTRAVDGRMPPQPVDGRMPAQPVDGGHTSSADGRSYPPAHSWSGHVQSADGHWPGHVPPPTDDDTGPRRLVTRAELAPGEDV